MADIEKLQAVPYSLEAERAVLGTILLSPDCYGVVSFLAPDDFYLNINRVIYEAISSLSLSQQPIDEVIVLEALKKLNDSTLGDISKYIVMLTELSVNEENVEAYAKIVRDKSLLRKLIEACGTIAETARSDANSIEDVLEAAESSIHEISDQKYSKEFSVIDSLLKLNLAELQDKFKNPNKKFGVQTNYEHLDKVLVGMGLGDLIIIGGRPGMGKTSFALNIACNVAKASEKAVAIFSLEMSAGQLSSRLLGSEALVDSDAMLSGRLQEDDWKRIASASSALSKTRLYINDSSNITVNEMKSKLRKIDDLGLVIIDYLQLMHDGRYTDNRVLEIAQITRSLKIMAKEMRVPVILCSQLSRPPKETRQVKKPQLSDLRDSGAIEQDADIVIFIHREKYYKAGEQSAEEMDENEQASIIVAKNRHGKTGTVKLDWYGRYFRFLTASYISEDTESNE